MTVNIKVDKFATNIKFICSTVKNFRHRRGLSNTNEKLRQPEKLTTWNIITSLGKYQI